MPLMVPRQRQLDLEAAARVDVFLANSTETQARIQKYYRRSSTVVHPPVETKRFSPQRIRGNHYVTIGRQLPYKRYDLAVAAATKLGIPLIVFGSGTAHDKLVTIAGPTVSFRTDRFGDASDAEFEKVITAAKGFIYPAEEDFGIVSVEALAAGAPVIGYGKAGTLDIVQDGVSGVLFDEQTIESITAAIQKAEKMTFLPSTLQRKAKRFDTSVFARQMRQIVQREYSKRQRN